jgi:hypothetical protein
MANTMNSRGVRIVICFALPLHCCCCCVLLLLLLLLLLPPLGIPAGFWPKEGQPQGTYAQYAAVDESHLALLPGAIPLDTAGGLPLVGLTAWQVGRRGRGGGAA